MEETKSLLTNSLSSTPYQKMNFGGVKDLPNGPRATTWSPT